jgi:hypothetical protein
MEISLTIEVKLPDVEIDSIVFDEAGNATITLSWAGAQSKCWIDAGGSDHGSINDALISLAGILIAQSDLNLHATPRAQEQPRRPM